ncbi:MAG: Dabb family protein, partial [Planctomycetia bacterium]|nr:Dabb family protein [Planctomycetia bacterium]
LKAVQQNLKEANQQITALKTVNKKLVAENNKLEAALKKGKGTDAKDEKTIKNLQTIVDGYRGAGLVHVVFLKLKADSPMSEAQSVIDDTYSQLSKIKTVRGVWGGKPATKPTPDANTEYTVALVFVFDDAAGLRAYLKDPIHDKFAEKHLSKWEAPLVYDFETKK